MASPFLRFCPIGVKVIQAEYIQNNDLIVLHHCSYFRAASTSLEDTTEWVRYFNKIRTKKIRNRNSHYPVFKMTQQMFVLDLVLKQDRGPHSDHSKPLVQALCGWAGGETVGEGRSGILGSKCQMSLSSSRETYFHNNVTHYSSTMWRFLAPQRLGKCHKYGA